MQTIYDRAKLKREEPIKTQPAPTTVGTPTNVDTSSMAKSPYGNLEMTKYIYENNLQNIFNTYQQNVATLSKEKQQSLQDAYYIREMSKKYLGEYASNVGVGDVSGDLLNIYGDYQKNIADIQGNFAGMELELEKQYQASRQENFNNILMTQYGIDVAKFQEGEKQIFFNLEMGQYGEFDNASDYIRSEYANGNLSEEGYRQAQLWQKEMDMDTESREILIGLSSGKYSAEEVNEMFMNKKISPEQYQAWFENNKTEKMSSLLTELYKLPNREAQNQRLQNALDTGEITQAEYDQAYIQLNQSGIEQSAKEFMKNIVTGTTPEGFENFSDYLEYGLENDYIGVQDFATLYAQANPDETATTIRSSFALNDPDADPKYKITNAQILAMTNDPNVNEKSEMYFVKLGDIEQKMISAGVPVDEDTYFGGGSGIPAPSILDIQNEKGTTLIDGTPYEYNGEFFVKQGNQLFRLIKDVGAFNLDENQMKSFSADNALSGYKTNGDGSKAKNRDTFEYNGIKYFETKAQNFKVTDTKNKNYNQELVDLFNRVHGSKTSVAVFYNGYFWNKDVNGEISKMERVTKI